MGGIYVASCLSVAITVCTNAGLLSLVAPLFSSMHIVIIFYLVADTTEPQVVETLQNVMDTVQVKRSIQTWLLYHLPINTQSTRELLNICNK